MMPVCIAARAEERRFTPIPKKNSATMARTKTLLVDLLLFMIFASFR
jgi:hypothetical protein